MAKIVKNIEELVGRTPLFEFEKFEEKHDIKAHLLGKLEDFNKVRFRVFSWIS